MFIKFTTGLKRNTHLNLKLFIKQDFKLRKAVGT